MLLLLMALLPVVYPQAFMNNVPIYLQLQGTTTYIPSTGGVPIPGYTITIGFDRYQWLGVMFMTLTSTNNFDTLVLQRSTSPNSGVYTCSVSDYYVSSGRPGTLMLDTMTSNDRTTTSTSTSSSFTLTFPRTTGNTNGEDWQGGQFVKICFFTSDSVFSQATWSKQYEVCFGYQVINYVSTFRGSQLGVMQFQGVDSLVYGGIYGPFLNLQVYWHRNSLIISNTSNMIIRVGNQIDADTGYDFYVCGDGDYYGTDPSNLMSDLIYSGYDNGACTFTTTTQSIMMTYTRDIFTFDTFDSKVGQSFSICLIGTQSHCGSFTLPINYPSMSVLSALTISQPYLSNGLSLILLLIMLSFV